jgi:Uma2 family endonuclease
MATVQHTRATLDDLMRAEGKAELIGGRIVDFMATGRLPNKVAGRIYRSLDDYAMARGVGEAYTDNMGFTVKELSSGRESFSPDASYFAGPFPPNPMKFPDHAPTFAVEVRSENDYGPAAETEMAAKRDDYFEAGTRVVWDVDCENEVIRSYRAEDPLNPTVFARDDLADAGPALPGWQVAVERFFA